METKALDGDGATTCPICMEPWTSQGAHRISCLPCGHLFGWSCIKKWIQQGGKRSGKCPQCNMKCKFSEIRILYVPHIAVVDGEMRQELTSLRAENEKLKLQLGFPFQDRKLYHDKDKEDEGATPMDICEPSEDVIAMDIIGDPLRPSSSSISAHAHDIIALSQQIQEFTAINQTLEAFIAEKDREIATLRNAKGIDVNRFIEHLARKDRLIAQLGQQLCDLQQNIAPIYHQ